MFPAQVNEPAGGNTTQIPGIVATNELPVILVIDTSGSMAEPPSKIGAVNEGVRKVLEYLTDDLVRSDPKVKPMFACLEFESGANWIFQYQEAKDLAWTDQDAKGGTDFGDACMKLHTFLTTKEKGGSLPGRKGVLKPIIIVMSDGQSEPYLAELEKLKERGWYSHALKFGIAIGNDADKQMLLAFTGKSESIYTTDNYASNLSRLLRIVVQTASVVSMTDPNTTSQSQGGNATNNITSTTTVDVAQDQANIAVKDAWEEMNSDTP